MINIEKMDDRAMRTGESRSFVLRGDGPFKVSSRCFVDQPRPPGPGFVHCDECTVQTVNSGDVVTIESSPEMWHEKNGYVEVRASNKRGEVEVLKFTVLPDSDHKPTTKVLA